MGKSSSPPPAPDYTGAATAQGAANKEAALISSRMSNPNVYGPLGQQTVSYGTGDEQYTPTIRQTLNPEPQAALESQQRVQHQLARLGEQGVATAQNALANPFSSTTPPLQTELDKSGLAAMPVNAGMTGQQAIMSRLEPTLQRRSNALQQTLANQGLVSGGEAYTNAMRDESQSQNDLLTQAALQGINLDTGARAQGFNELTSEQGAENSARSAELQRQLAMRGQPLNEITGLMSGSQIQLPQFQNFQGQQVQAAPIFQAAQAQGQNDMNQYGVAQSGKNAMISGLYGVAGMGARGFMGTPMGQRIFE